MSQEREYRPRSERGEKAAKPQRQDEEEERSWDEKWRRDPLSAAAWAVILIWAGFVLLANNFRLFEYMWFLDAWSVFFLGAGAILFLELGLRLLLPAYRQPVIGNLILAVILVAIGFGGIVDWKCILPGILIGVGGYALYTGLFRRPK